MISNRVDPEDRTPLGELLNTVMPALHDAGFEPSVAITDPVGIGVVIEATVLGCLLRLRCRELGSRSTAPLPEPGTPENRARLAAEYQQWVADHPESAMAYPQQDAPLADRRRWDRQSALSELAHDNQRPEP